MARPGKQTPNSQGKNAPQPRGKKAIKPRGEKAANPWGKKTPRPPGKKAAQPRQPQQPRSRKTLERILVATEDLLADRDFEDISIADIAKRARVAVGTLYTRFATKDDILPFLITRLQDQQLACAPDLLSDPGDRDMGLEARIACQIRGSAQALMGPKRGLCRAIARRHLGGLLEIPSEEIEKARKLHGYLFEWLLECRREIRHPQPETAVAFAIYMMTTSLSLKILFGHPVHRIADDDFIEESVKAVVGYLTGEGPTIKAKGQRK